MERHHLIRILLLIVVKREHSPLHPRAQRAETSRRNENILHLAHLQQRNLARLVPKIPDRVSFFYQSAGGVQLQFPSWY